MLRFLSLVCIACVGCGFSLHLGGDAGGDDDGGPQSDGAVDQMVTPWLDGYMYRRAITLHASQIEAPNDGALNGFPVMLALAEADLVRALADRTDLAFTETDATTPLAHEIETFDSATTTAWVKVPSLSATAETTIYVYYGHPTPPPPTPEAVWTESFTAVYHLQQNPGPGASGEIRDSTSVNGHHGTADSSFAPGDSVTSPFGRALDFNGNNSCVTVPALDVGNQFTISVWMKLNDVSQIRTLVASSQDGSNTNGFRFFVNSNGSSDRKVWLETGNGSQSNSVTTASNAITVDVWAHVAVIVDRTAGAARVMIDGATVMTDMTIRNDFSTTMSLEIGRMKNNNVFDGLLDEVEIASTMRSPQWIQTAYNNQRSSMDFYTVMDEEARP